MNKLVKASIAGAAGFALLLGGAGTFALWNSNQVSFVGSSVQSGSLHVALSARATAKYTGTDHAVSFIVPGDKVSVSQPVNITATGDNLRVSLKFAVNVGTPTTPLEQSIYQNGITFTAYNGAGQQVSYTDISASQAAQIKWVVASFSFPASADDTTQNSSIDISRASVIVNQI